jgi:tRNA pseudouridine38-40 synthase
MPVALLLAYDGTGFHGYQRQAAAREPTVQGTLEAAIQRTCGMLVPTAAAGRTDAGVHARGQVVTFAPPPASRLDPAAWQRALNARLPASMAVRAAGVVAEGVHARRSATAREYRYRLLVAEVRDPFRARFTHRVPRSLDVAAMRTACGHLLGEHDFAAFGQSPWDAAGQPKHHTMRRLFRAEVAPHGDEIWCDFAANAFLTGMVRRLVGILLLVGAGKLAPAEVAAILAARTPEHPGPAAPACGLCLMRATYPAGTLPWPADTSDGEATNDYL